MSTLTAPKTVAPEARSGLDPWRIDELPPAPRPKGLGWFSAIGPGVIALGVSIGSGEFLLGPAAFVKYGLSLLWIVGLAALLQTLLNVELMRYTMATGEPVVTGFMRSFTFSKWAGPVGRELRRAQSSFWPPNVCQSLERREPFTPSASVFI